MNSNYYKTVHLFCLGAAIGLLLASVLVKMDRVASIPQDKWFIPFVMGLIFLLIEFAIQRKPK